MPIDALHGLPTMDKQTAMVWHYAIDAVLAIVIVCVLCWLGVVSEDKLEKMALIAMVILIFVRQILLGLGR